MSTTSIKFTIRDLNGAVVPLTRFLITSGRPESGAIPVEVPYQVEFTTDASGQATVALEASLTIPYYINKRDGATEQIIAYKFFVPVATTTLEGELLYVDMGIRSPKWNDATLAALIESKVTAVNAANQALQVVSLLGDVSTIRTNLASLVEVGTNIDSVVEVASNTTNINTVAVNTANISKVAVIDTKVTTVADNDANVTTVADNIANVNTVGAIASKVSTVADNNTNVSTVANSIANVTSVGNNITNVNTVANNTTNINTVASNTGSTATVASNIAAVQATATGIGNIPAILPYTDNIVTVATNITPLVAVGNNMDNINEVRAMEADIEVLADNIAYLADAAAAVTQAVDAQKELYVAGVDYTEGVTTYLALTYFPAKSNSVKVFFSGVYQNKDSWTRVGKTISFNAPIDASQVEIHYEVPSSFVGLSPEDILVIQNAETAAEAAAVDAQQSASAAAVSASSMSQAVDGNKDLFVAGVQYTKGVSTQLTLSAVPVKTNTVKVFFNGLYQNSDTYSRASATLTFTQPIYVDQVEVQYEVPSQFVGLDAGDVAYIDAAQTAAQASANAAAQSFDSFDDRYLGAKTTAPSVDNDSNTILVGAKYFNSIENKMYVRNASNVWQLATADSSDVGYLPAGTGAVAADVQSKLRESVSVKDFGAVGDGVADDTLAIQAALNTQRPVYVTPGKYRITSELIFLDGSVLFSDMATFFMQNVLNTPLIGTVAEIFYDGVGGANSCILRMSKLAVGTKPTFSSTEANTLRGAGVSGLYLNGNNKAEFGLYSARAGLGCVYKDLAVTGTKKHGLWFGELWLSQLFNIAAFHNGGCGITIGQDTFSWAGGNVINAISIDNIFTYKNGLDLVSWTEADYQLGYGIGLYLGRSCSVRMIDAEWNSGVGVVIAPTSGSASISEIYTENNCHTLPTSSERFQVWYQSGADAYFQFISGLYTLFNAVTPSGNTNAPRLKITGTPPAVVSNTYGQQIPVFDRINFSTVLDATFGVYKVTNSTGTGTIRYISHYPQFNDHESITSSQTILYAGNTASGTGSGIDASNRCTLATAVNIARVLASAVTIDVSAMTSTSTPSAFIDITGTGFSRPIAIDGGSVGRFVNDATYIAFKASNWSAGLTVQNMLAIDRCYVDNSNVVFNNCPTMRTGTNNLAAPGISVANSKVQISGTSVINVGGSTAATKIGIAVSNNSEVAFNNAAAGTIASFTAGNAIHFNEGSGVVRVSLTTATATWAAAASVVRNTGGGAGVVIAPNGLNP